MNLLGESDNNATILYGGADNPDSVLISYDDIRVVNSKLVELEYEKQINNKLKLIISADSVLTDSLSNRLDRINSNNKSLLKTNSKLKKQRNVVFGVALVTTILAVISICR